MLLGGLWHGAAWNFVALGRGPRRCCSRSSARSGVERLYGAAAARRCAWRSSSRWCCFTWVFFRAPDLPAALDYFARLFGLAPVQEGALLLAGLLYGALPARHLRRRRRRHLARSADLGLDPPPDAGARARPPLALLAAALAVLATQDYNPFIYFIF